MSEAAGPAAEFRLAPLFRQVEDVMIARREELNATDPVNGNHGDHMAAIFQVATQAAEEKEADGLAKAMEYAGALLAALPDNASAQVYARGLAHLAHQFRLYNVGLGELLPYVRGLAEDRPEGKKEPQAPGRGRDVLKALVSALAGWKAEVENPPEPGSELAPKPYDMGYLFDLGIAYMQAKSRGGSKNEVLADAAASVSPLGQAPHRYESGKIAIRALLDAMSG